MNMAQEKRKPPGGRGGLSGNSVVTANFDISRDNPTGSKKQVECARSGLRPFGKIAAGIATDLRSAAKAKPPRPKAMTSEKHSKSQVRSRGSRGSKPTRLVKRRRDD